MTLLETYRWAAANQCLMKWHEIAKSMNNKSLKLDAKMWGIVCHDRYLCGDFEKGRVCTNKREDSQ